MSGVLASVLFSSGCIPIVWVSKTEEKTPPGVTEKVDKLEKRVDELDQRLQKLEKASAGVSKETPKEAKPD